MTGSVYYDAKGYRIPNQLIVFGYLAGLCLNIASYQEIGIIYFILKAVTPVLLLLLTYLCKGLGAGDIKLFSVMCTLIGLRATVDVMITSVMLAGITVLLIFLYERNIDLKRKLHYSYYIAAAFMLLSSKRMIGALI